MKTIKQQIKKQLKLYFCWTLVIISGFIALVTKNLIFVALEYLFLVAGLTVIFKGNSWKKSGNKGELNNERPYLKRT